MAALCLLAVHLEQRPARTSRQLRPPSHERRHLIGDRRPPTRSIDFGQFGRRSCANSLDGYARRRRLASWSPLSSATNFGFLCARTKTFDGEILDRSKSVRRSARRLPRSHCDGAPSLVARFDRSTIIWPSSLVARLSAAEASREHVDGVRLAERPRRWLIEQAAVRQECNATLACVGNRKRQRSHRMPALLH
jgi:hypothetical protein